MNFSDWITIVSILAAVLLAVFKFDEWEIIRRRKFKKYFWRPLIFLFLGGLSAYYHSNPHPSCLNLFWSNYGFHSGLWPIIWMIGSFCSLSICWIKFTNERPSHDLIKKYLDYLDNYEPSKFSSLFRKYERYFFKSKDEDAWLPYELILTSEKWWSIAPINFIEIVCQHPNRIYEMDKNVLKSLLIAQFLRIPHSQLTKELEEQGKEINLSDETPILNMFLSSSYYIETCYANNNLLPSIMEIAEEYFYSIQFTGKDKPIFLLKPAINSLNQIAPKSLLPFYFIQFINCYWYQVFRTNAKVSGFFFYFFWTQDILDTAPEIDVNYKIDILPNLYLSAVDRMLSNIHSWIKYIKDENITEFVGAAIHFAELKRSILAVIQENYKKKIPQLWFEAELKCSLKEMIVCRDLFGNKFNPDLSNYIISSSLIKRAFIKLTDEDYLEKEKQKDGYKWLENDVDNLQN